MYARYLLACLDMQFPEIQQKTEPRQVETRHVETRHNLKQHSDQKRFKGTKVYLSSPTISPDYEFVATIDHTENDGSDVWLVWQDVNGRRIGPYKLKEDESIRIINIKDAEELKVKPTPTEVVRHIHEAREAREPTQRNPIAKLSEYLKKNDISNKLVEGRINLLYGKLYIEYEGGFELGDTRRGVIARFQDSKEGVKRLIKRILKIENETDFEKMLKKVAV